MSKAKSLVKTHSKESSELHPLLGAVAGAVVGGIAGAVAVSILNNKENREKVGYVIQDLTTKTIETLKEANNQKGGLQSVAKKTLTEKIDEVGDKYLSN